MTSRKSKANMAHRKPRTKKANESYDVVIAGGGPAGLTMAARLGDLSLSVLVVEREPREKLTSQAFDGRTTAIAYGSMLILGACGVWQKLADKACPIDDIRVADQKSPIALNFESNVVGDNPFGYIIENTHFRMALFERVAEFSNVTLACPALINDIRQDSKHISLSLSDGREVTAKLLIAADGKKSFCREAAGIKARHWSYNETALVVTIGHEHEHGNLALEQFYPGGPYAVLPMTNNRSSIVWTERPSTAAALQTMPENAFIDLLKDRGCAFLGDIKLLTPRQLYPLRFMLADKLYGPRIALIGEAAHGMHPVAGQGFNLSVRDIGVLGNAIECALNAGQDIGTQELLRSYASGRHFDHFTFMTATDVLVKLFSNNFPPLRLARQMGLGIVSKIPLAKNFFSRVAMGLLT